MSTPVGSTRVEGAPKFGVAGMAAMSKTDHGDTGKDQPRTFSAQDVRQGEIILKRRRQRLIFIAGLAAAVLVILLVRLAG